MNILVINNYSKHINELSNLLKNHNVTIVENDKFDGSINKDINLIILTGGHRKSIMRHQEEFKNELDIIKKTGKPIIGICLGAEMIAYTYGGKMKKMLFKKKGYYSVTSTQQKNNLITKNKVITVFEAHRWTIKELPSSFEVYAVSKDGIEIFKHAKKAIYGLQFHPEVNTIHNDGQLVFQKILQEI